MHPSRPSTARAAFTLIEMLIALAAGTMIVLTATAGFRAASQAVSVANLHFVENMMLRSGMEIALEEVDFWTTEDQPDRPDRQTMRGKVGKTNAGLPFIPFRTSLLGTDSRPGLFSEDSQGWNPNPMARAAWNARTWFRDDHGEGVNDAILPWGNYTIYTYSQAGNSQSDHHWYEGQVHGLMDTLGFYGIMEYMPSNAFFSYHGVAPLTATNQTIGLGGAPQSMQIQGDFFYPTDGGDECPKGRIRSTLGSRYFLPAVANSAMATLCRTYNKIGYEGRDTHFNPAAVDAFFQQVANYPEVMDVLPYEWPQVQIQVLRFVERGRMVTSCVIRCYDAKNGNSFILPFTCAGTTLRGARQQRTPRLGWVQNPYTDPTLDYDKVP